MKIKTQQSKAYWDAAKVVLLLLSRLSRVRPQRRQPTRLPHPWDSPGKNTAVGCHFLPQCMKVKSESEVTQSCPTSRPHGLQPTRLLHPWDFPGKSTGVGCHCLLWKVALGGNFIIIQTYIRNWEKSQINNVNVHLKQIKKNKQNPVSKRKEIKIRAEINEIDDKNNRKYL